MIDAPRGSAVVIALMCFAALVFAIGINWGLPSHAVDPYLFGDTEVWSGEKIARLAPTDKGDVGADVDSNPIANRNESVVLNATDEQRAEIIQRYRLFSYQPDEMITLKSLSKIKQFKGDPRLYQYGGLWIYPVGALIKIILNPSPDRAFYFDHPEAFGKFYVVARAYSAAWGVVGVWAVFWLARRLSGNVFISAAAATCYIFMPIVINMAHEAKPHLPGTVLMLLAVIAAVKYVEMGTMKWAIVTGALCGAAFGMVLSALPVFLILPVMVMLRARQSRWKHLIVAVAAGVSIYVVTNPYVVIHLLGDRMVLQSNLKNSTAMYEIGSTGFLNALRLIREGMSMGLLVGAVMGGAALILRRKTAKPQANPWALLLVLAGLILIQFVALAAGKPGEYARFALFVDVVLALVACVGLGKWFESSHKFPSAIVLCVLIVMTAMEGARYEGGYILDSRTDTTRLAAAAQLARRLNDGAEIAVSAEPAPYAIPPVNLFKWKIVLPPRGEQVTQSASLAIQPFDESTFTKPSGFYREFWFSEPGAHTPISWAAKPFLVLTRRAETEANR